MQILPGPYNSKGSDKIAFMRRLSLAFAGSLCNKYTFSHVLAAYIYASITISPSTQIEFCNAFIFFKKKSGFISSHQSAVASVLP